MLLPNPIEKQIFSSLSEPQKQEMMELSEKITHENKKTKEIKNSAEEDKF